MEVTIRDCSDSVLATNMISSIYEQQVAQWLGLAYEGWMYKLKLKHAYYSRTKCLVQPGYGNHYYVALNIDDSASGRPNGTKPGVWKGDYNSAFKFREYLMEYLEDLPSIEWIYGDGWTTGVFPEIVS